MSTIDLPLHLKAIKKSLELLWPSVRKAGNEEHKQLVGAMYDSLTLSERLYYELPPPDEESWDQWRHDVVRPLSLCINSSELLLTDTDDPLNDEQRQHIQAVYEQSMLLSRRIDDLYTEQMQT
jgi:light-regulated signal transduction histidine kinase (bacteriophytochrome)